MAEWRVNNPPRGDFGAPAGIEVQMSWAAFV